MRSPGPRFQQRTLCLISDLVDRPRGEVAGAAEAASLFPTPSRHPSSVLLKASSSLEHRSEGIGHSKEGQGRRGGEVKGACIRSKPRPPSFAPKKVVPGRTSKSR